MFTRIKQSRNGEYLQVVENYRDAGRVRQRSVLYVGHYDSLDEALEWMPMRLKVLRGRATRAENHYKGVAEGHTSEARLAEAKEWSERERRKADELAAKLEEVRTLVANNPQLLERDRERASRLESSLERRSAEQIEAAALRRGYALRATMAKRMDERHAQGTR
jgi:hypothetical protein